MVKDDYDLSELQEIHVRDLRFNIMPRYLYHYTDKDYEKFSLDLLDTIVAEDGVAIDIGAHYGIYSLLSAKKSKKVYAFEPVPENFKILQKNIHDNGLEDKIIPINKATSDSEGKVKFNVTWASDSAGFYEHPNAEVIRKITVQTNSIDNELKDIKDVSFIKIDTEGHELHVLEGLRQTLKNNKKAKMLIEFNPECLVNAGAGTRQLIEKILSLGYDIFAVHEDSRHMVKVDQDTSDETILRGLTYLNFLCLPRGSYENMLFLCHNSGIGGAELVLFETVEELTRMKDKFVIPFVILPGNGPLVEKFATLPIPMQIIPMRGWTDNLGLNESESTDTKIINSNAVAQISRVMSDFKPQVSYTNTLSIPWGAFVAKSFNIPHVWSIHEFGDLDHGLVFDYGYETSLRYVDKLSDTVIVNSRAVYDHVARYIPQAKLKVLHPNVRPAVLSMKPPANPFKKDTEIKLAMTGRITAGKGQFDAVKAVHKLQGTGHTTELVLIGEVGSETYYDEILAYCKKYNIEHSVHFVGLQKNPSDYLAMADIVLVCSRNEAFGRVTIEAMLLGKPVVAAKSGGTMEIIDDGVNGLLYEAKNSDDLAEKITMLVTKKMLTTIGSAGQKSASAEFPNDYAISVHDIMKKTGHSTADTINDLTPLKDIFIGMNYQIQKTAVEYDQMTQAHREEIEKFSAEYNKVYASYNELERQIKVLHDSKLVRAHEEISRLRNKLKKNKA